jgi:dihydroorotate dehydrogenase electron transfer subunit
VIEPPFRVERGGTETLAALCAIAAASFEAPWSEGAFAEEFRAPESAVWVTRDAWGAVRGYLVARRAHDEVHVLSLAVEPAARRRGLATALLRAALGAERARGARFAHLEVRASNPEARSLYARLGFRAVGRRPRYYPSGEDALLLTARLGAVATDAPNQASPATGAAAPAGRVDAPVLENEAAGGAGLRLRLDVGGAFPPAEPGQFVMLSPGALPAATRFDPLLPRPMAVFRLGGGVLDVLYKVTGRGTALLAAARPGERVRVVGPLGRGFPLPAPGERALLVGGGTGIASLFDLAARARAASRVAAILAAKSARELLGVDDFRALGVEVRVATEDGSAGRRGLATELLADALREGPARVYACGPTGMMRRAAELAAAAGRRCVASLENRMACGFGVCLGCAVPRAREGYALVCREGPVFEAEALRWDGLP